MNQNLTSMTLEFSPATAKKLVTIADSHDETPAELIARLLKNKKPKLDGKPITFPNNPELQVDSRKTLDFRGNANKQCQCGTKSGKRCTSKGVLKPVHTGIYIYMACAKHIREANNDGVILPHSSSDPSLGGFVS